MKKSLKHCLPWMLLGSLLLAGSMMTPSLAASEAGFSPEQKATSCLVSELDAPPKLVEHADPELPQALAGKKGLVRVGILIDTDGKVEDLRVLKASHDDFVEPTLEAIRGWVYTTARQEGEPVKARFAVTMRFK